MQQQQLQRQQQSAAAIQPGLGQPNVLPQQINAQLLQALSASQTQQSGHSQQQQHQQQQLGIWSLPVGHQQVGTAVNPVAQVPPQPAPSPLLPDQLQIAQLQQLQALGLQQQLPSSQFNVPAGAVGPSPTGGQLMYMAQGPQQYGAYQPGTSQLQPGLPPGTYILPSNGPEP